MGAVNADVEENIQLPMPSAKETVPGDLWQLGRHRLLCGDCRNS